MEESPLHESDATDDAHDSGAKTCPLSAMARRVLGVLVEKAKTTPDNYPLSLAAIVTGSNQKSNRSPQMSISEDEAVDALDELRQAGAAREVQGSGRVTKYRHAMYEWMDVQAAGSAIMTELLLRGPQTVGQLRTRAGRMHNFDDLDAVTETLGRLEQQGLVEPLTPPGRGQLFAHCLYPPQEKPHLEPRVEKLTAGDDPPVSPRSPNHDAIDALLDRMRGVEGRIEELERRLKELES